MAGSSVSRGIFILPILAFVLCCGVSRAAELNPAAVTFILPDKVDLEARTGRGQ